jgi:lipopolysaccharide transport system ATP-binding protein
MSEPTIQVENVSRVFRIYANARDRVWSAFHLEFIHKPKYRELWALRDVNARVAPGERVGIVGRNGAGKSTLLKIVCGNLPPTEGQVRVKGRIQALMELGTGFHPDFSGRDNIAAYLGYQGIVGKEAQRLEEEAADFSELEDFLDFPVKTYSAGMYARLAFSAATCFEPEVLIIDEVLGAGDAYFAGKCLERMRDLTSRGATVLFVSHDLSSVQLLCQRAIWIDRGKVLADGDCLEVSRSYMAEVRKEEDDRLRAVSQKIRKRASGTIHRADEIYRPMIFHLVCDGDHPQQEHVVFRLALKQGRETIREIRVGDAMDNHPDGPAFIYDDAGFMDWSRPRKVGRRYARAYCNRGGRYNHAPWEFRVPIGKEADSEPMQLEIEYLDFVDETVHVEVYQGDAYVRLGSIAPSGTSEVSIATFLVPREEQGVAGPEATEPGQEVEPEQAAAPAVDPIAPGEGYGTGEGRITGFSLLDAEGRPSHLLEVESRAVARIEYAFAKPVPEPTFVVCIYRADGTCMGQVHCRAGEQWRDDRPMRGRVEAVFDPLLLGRGHYSVSVAIFHHLDLANPNEPPAYHLINRFYRFQVVQPAGVNMELGAIVCPVSWVQSHHAASEGAGTRQLGGVERR